MHDSVSDFLARLRNAAAAKHRDVRMPSSRLKVELGKALKAQGFVSDVKVEEGVKAQLTVTLRYTQDGQPVLRGGRRVSRPGRRVYVGASDIPRVRDGLGTSLMSTSSGILSGHQAFKRRIGGEILFEVW